MGPLLWLRPCRPSPCRALQVSPGPEHHLPLPGAAARDRHAVRGTVGVGRLQQPTRIQRPHGKYGQWVAGALHERGDGQKMLWRWVLGSCPPAWRGMSVSCFACTWEGREHCVLQACMCRQARRGGCCAAFSTLCLSPRCLLAPWQRGVGPWLPFSRVDVSSLAFVKAAAAAPLALALLACLMCLPA
jgi:hypothetical protein